MDKSVEEKENPPQTRNKDENSTLPSPLSFSYKKTVGKGLLALLHRKEIE
jgi:hypothetical protein